MAMANLVSTRSTCRRRQVGCVLVNWRNHVLATGYNGVPSGASHCAEDAPCEGWDAPSGERLDACQAIHAEQNALIQCRDAHAIATAYVTAFPCVHCTKILLNTSCRRIVYGDEYPGGQALWKRQKKVLERLYISPEFNQRDVVTMAKHRTPRKR